MAATGAAFAHSLSNPKRQTFPAIDLNRLHLYVGYSERNAKRAETEIAAPLEAMIAGEGAEFAGRHDLPRFIASIETRVQPDRINIEAVFEEQVPDSVRNEFRERIAHRAPAIVPAGAALEIRRTLSFEESIAEFALPASRAHAAVDEQSRKEFLIALNRDLERLHAHAAPASDPDFLRTHNGDPVRLYVVRGRRETDHVGVMQLIERAIQTQPALDARMVSLRESRTLSEVFNSILFSGALTAALIFTGLLFRSAPRIAGFAALAVPLLIALWYALLHIAGEGVNMVSAAIFPGGLFFCAILFVFAAASPRRAGRAAQFVPVLLAGGGPLLFTLPLFSMSGAISDIAQSLGFSVAVLLGSAVGVALLLRVLSGAPIEAKHIDAAQKPPGAFARAFTTISLPSLSVVLAVPAISIAVIALSFSELRFTLFPADDSAYSIGIRNASGSARQDTERDLKTLETILLKHAAEGLRSADGVAGEYRQHSEGPYSKFAPHFASLRLDYEGHGDYTAEDLQAILTAHWPLSSGKIARINIVDMYSPVVLPQTGVIALDIRRPSTPPRTNVVTLRLYGSPEECRAGARDIKRILGTDFRIAAIEDEALQYAKGADEHLKNPGFVTRFDGVPTETIRLIVHHEEIEGMDRLIQDVLSALEDRTEADIRYIPDNPEPPAAAGILFAAPLSIALMLALAGYACFRYRSVLPFLAGILPGPAGAALIALSVYTATGHPANLVWILGVPITAAGALIPIAFVLENLRALHHKNIGNPRQRLQAAVTQNLPAVTAAAGSLLTVSLVGAFVFDTSLQHFQWLNQIACTVYLSYVIFGVIPGWLWLEDGLRVRNQKPGRADDQDASGA